MKEPETTPPTYFHHIRDGTIERAKEMLLRTDLATVEVALKVGFCSQSHFTEAFRRRVGQSPARWRAMRRA